MQNFLSSPISTLTKKITFRHVLIALILIIAIVTRLYNLDARVMSHDEVNHVVPSFDLYAGRGYKHDPITHGPLQFHLVALSYFLFGDGDFTSRLPHAIFSIATIAFVLIYYRRYLGKYGSIAAGLFYVISPYLLFYGRYARNEAFCAFQYVVIIYALLRYLEEKKPKFLFFFVIAFSLNFCTKETAYIFTAELLIFFLLLTLMDVIKLKWQDHKIKKEFILFNLSAIFVVVLALGVSIILLRNLFGAVQNGTILIPSTTELTGLNFLESMRVMLPLFGSMFPAMLILFGSILFLITIREKLHWDALAQSGVFNILILTGTLVLPLLAPFPVKFAGADPIDYTNTLTILFDYIYLMFMAGLSVTIGLIWQKKDWWKYALVFFGIYTVLYTTFFTNSVGLLTGSIGSLGYWMAQQGVGRGGQPIYYFALVQIPIYEYLGAFGVLLALIIGFKKKSFWARFSNEIAEKKSAASSDDNETAQPSLIPVPAMFIFLSILSLIAYSMAGEKMPWITVHITFVMLLTAGWVVNYLVEKFISLDDDKFGKWKSLLLTLLFVFLTLLLLVQLWGNHAPFQGKTQQNLQDTNHFILMFFLECLSGFFLIRQENKVNVHKLFITACLSIFMIMSVFTFRTAYQASFINYDYPYEFLVYAHAADGPKIVLKQVEEISRRTTGGLDIKVAYDNHGLYPYWWYLRNYPNKIVYLENPTRALEEAPLIIAGSDKYDKIDAIVKDNYYSYEYMRLWWPMQDYWNLTWDRIQYALTNADMRQALFKIWLNRDYTYYAQITNNSYLTLDNWLPSERLRLYVRKDIAAQMWQLNTEASTQQIVEMDPYKAKMVEKQPDYFIGISGSEAGQLNGPRGIDVGSDGSIYVADSHNNRIQKFTETGELLESFGTYASILEGDAPGGTMSEPWDVAVGKDGSIYVADTFNHRIEKYTADGKFIKMIGVFAAGDSPDSIWGPRALAIDASGNVLITDTGNKRVVVYDADFNYITQFGGAGFEAGQFDEPVGIAISASGQVVVADTWNRRVQIFESDESGLVYTQVSSFDVDAWYGQGIENKPYLTVSPENTILISDPESGRILEFSMDGEYLRGWEGLSVSADQISQPFGMDFDPYGNLWVSDGSSDLLLHFSYQDKE